MPDPYAYFRAQERFAAAQREQEAAEKKAAEAAAEEHFRTVEAPAFREKIRAEVIKEMVLSGIPKEEARRVVLAHDDRITIHPGPSGKIDGLGLSLRQGSFTHELIQEVRNLSYGPAPAVELARRLWDAGMPLAEATPVARTRVARDRDGVIIYTPVKGDPIRGKDPSDMSPLDSAAHDLMARFEEQRRNPPRTTPVTTEDHRKSVTSTASYCL